MTIQRQVNPGHAVKRFSDNSQNNSFGFHRAGDGIAPVRELLTGRESHFSTRLDHDRRVAVAPISFPADRLHWSQNSKPTAFETGGRGRVRPHGFSFSPVSKPVRLAYMPRRDTLSDAEVREKYPASQGLGEFVKSVGRGAVNFTGTTMQGMATISARDPKEQAAIKKILSEFPKIRSYNNGRFLKLMNRIRKELPENHWQDFISTASYIRHGRISPDSQPHSLKSVRTTPLRETALYKMGQRVKKVSADYLPVTPGYEDSYTRTIGEGIGASIPLLLVAAGLRMPLPGITANTVIGTANSKGEAATRAIQAGASEAQIMEAARRGAMPGVAKQAPIEVLLERIPIRALKAFTPALNKVLKNAAASGGHDAVQQVWQNLIANYVYDPDQDILEGVRDAAIMGAAVGGSMSTAAETGRSVFRPNPAKAKGSTPAMNMPGTSKSGNTHKSRMQERQLHRSETPGGRQINPMPGGALKPKRGEPLNPVNRKINQTPKPKFDKSRLVNPMPRRSPVFAPKRNKSGPLEITVRPSKQYFERVRSKREK